MGLYDKPRTFTLTDDHIKLLANAVVSDNGDAPGLDSRYPWGRSGDFEDIAHILGWSLFEDHNGDKHLSPEQADRTRKIAGEMATALQVVLRTTSFLPGVYRTSSPYGDDWTLVEARP